MFWPAHVMFAIIFVNYEVLDKLFKSIQSYSNPSPTWLFVPCTAIHAPNTRMCKSAYFVSRALKFTHNIHWITSYCFGISNTFPRTFMGEFAHTFITRRYRYRLLTRYNELDSTLAQCVEHTRIPHRVGFSNSLIFS